MTYETLKEYIKAFQVEAITKEELVAAIHMWQRAQNYFGDSPFNRIPVYWSSKLGRYVTIPNGGRKA